MSKRFTLKSVLSLFVILFTALALVACGDDNQAVVDAALDAFAIEYATGDSATNVTQNVTLATASGEITVTWESDTPAVISNAGIVTRPAVGQADVTVTLTATLTLGDATAEKEFELTVKAQTLTDQEAVNAAREALMITLASGNTALSVTGNITLPANPAGITVTWASSNANVISNTGVVTRPAAGESNAQVTLTATLTKGSAVATKTFTLTVLANPVLITDQDIVDEALATLGVGFITGDSETSVTANVTLAAADGNVYIAWSSSNPAVISNAGVVTRPGKGQADVTVTLTAALSLGIAYETKTFTLVVKAVPYTAEDVLAALVISGDTLTYNTETERYTTTSDIVLPTNILGVPITWTSPNPAVLSNAGVVTRPAYGQPDSTVILTATILDDDYTFIVIVSAITEKPVELILSEARDILLLSGISNGVGADLTLPATVGTEGVTVTWASDTPDVLSDAGVVHRQPENVTVILTATLHYQDQTVTKEFEVIVLAAAEYTVVTGIAEAITLPEFTYVKIFGVTVVGRTTDGFMFADSNENILFVYTGGIPSEAIVVGSVYDLYGKTDYYYGVWQINATDANKPLVMTPSEADAVVLTPTPVTDVSPLIATLPTTYTEESPFVFQYIQLTAKVRVQNPDDNYQTVFVDAAYDGGDIDTAANSAFKTNALMIYYKSNKAALNPFDGLVVTLNVFLYSLRTDRNIFTVIFTGTIDDIQVALTDAELVQLVGSAVADDIPVTIPEDATLTLPTAMLGTSISWASSNASVIDPVTGTVTAPAVGQETVTLTATITKGEATYDEVIVITVGQLPVDTIQNAITNGGVVRVQGVVTNYTTYVGTSGTFYNVFIQDSSAGIYLYNVPAAIATPLLTIGNEVDVTGTVKFYNGLPELDPVTEVVLVSSDNVVTPQVVTTYDNVELQSYIGELITVEGYLKYEGDSATQNWYLITETGEYLVRVSNSLSADRATVQAAIADGTQAGQWITVTANLSWFGTPQIALYSFSQMTVGAVGSDAALGAIAAANLGLPAESSEVTMNITLPTTGLFGTTIAWTVVSGTAISDTGVVTRPAAGTSDDVVVLGYTATFGVTTIAEGTLTFTVLQEEPAAAQQVDLIISEYLEPSTGNSKALELFNPTNQTLDLSNYQIIQYNNGKTTADVAYMLDLVGTLAPGQTFVVYNVDADPAMVALIQANADVYQASIPYSSTLPGGAVMGFNGDDALVLMKKDTGGNFTVVVDSLGKVGVDPGSAWVSADTLTSTANMTLVRKATVLYGRTDITADFDPSEEWVAFAAQTWDYIGDHQLYSPDLFFSEYLEPSTGNSKALEIYNNTNQTIDLSNYQIIQYNNGKTTADVAYILDLVGTLAPGQTFVVYNVDADPAMVALIQANADVYQASIPYSSTLPGGAVMGFNGDDALVLMKKDEGGNFTVIVDSLGKMGVDPGSAWVSADTLTSTANMTLVRKATVLYGRTDITADFDPSEEWVAFAAQTWDYIGDHTLVGMVI